MKTMEVLMYFINPKILFSKAKSIAQINNHPKLISIKLQIKYRQNQ